MTERLEHLKQQIQKLVDGIDLDCDVEQVASGTEKLVEEAGLSDDERQELSAWLFDRADDKQAQSAASSEVAEAHRDAAEALRRHGVETIDDLPPQVQQEVVTRLEMAYALVGEESR